MVNANAVVEVEGDEERKYIVDEDGSEHGEDVEKILSAVKPYGTFQRILNLMLCILMGPPSFVVWLTCFIAPDVALECNTNSTYCLLNQTYSSADVEICAIDRKEWKFLQGSETSIALYYGLYCGKEWAIHMSSCVVFIGWGLGLFFTSFVADKYGRKTVIFPSLLVVIIFSFLCIFAPNIEVFMVFRFISGLGLSGSFHILFTLIGEFVTSKYRPCVIVLVMGANAFWVCVLCLKAYFIRDWKLLTIATTLPYLVILVFYWFVPETIHWLHLHGCREEMRAVLERVCYWNKKPFPEKLTTFEANARSNKPKSSPCGLFRTPALRSQTIRLLYVWFTMGMVYFSISLAAGDLTGSFYRDFAIIMAIEIPASVVGIYCCERFGRKKPISIGMLLASLACLAIAFIPITDRIKLLRLIFGVFGKACITMVFNTFLSWTMELYGTDLRANAMGVTMFASRMGGVSAPWIANALRHISRMAPFLMMGSLGLLAGCVLLTLPETKGVPLKTFSSSSKEKVVEHEQFMHHE